MNFGALLRDIRVRLGLSLKQVADVLGVTPVYVSDIERGNRAPLGTDKILALSDVPGLTPVDIENLMLAATSQRGAVQMTVPDNRDAQVALSGMARGGFSDDQWRDLRQFLENLRRGDR